MCALRRRGGGLVARHDSVLRMPKPPPRPPKTVVAFKVDPDLAAVLDAMPNKSELTPESARRKRCEHCRDAGSRA